MLDDPRLKATDDKEKRPKPNRAQDDSRYGQAVLIEALLDDVMRTINRGPNDPANLMTKYKGKDGDISNDKCRNK